MGKKAKAKKSESGNGANLKQEFATMQILDLAPMYGVTIVNAPEKKDGTLSDGQRAVQKQFIDEVLFSMWADKNGERVLAVLKSQGGALSIKAPSSAIRTIKI